MARIRSRSRSSRRLGYTTQEAPVVSVGADERRDPIPPGVYWIDSIDPSAYEDEDTVVTLRESYMALLKNAFSDAYEIIRTVTHEAQPVFNSPARDWILFEVTRPIPRWPPGTQWGFPTIAPNGRDTQEGDTVQKPPPEPGPLDTLTDETFGIPTWALVGGGLLALGVVVYAATR